jgi:hypothetical protein
MAINPSFFDGFLSGIKDIESDKIIIKNKNVSKKNQFEKSFLESINRLNRIKEINDSNYIICEDDLMKIGFEKISHYTVTNALIYKLGRHRYLSVGCVGTPNEMLWICETNDQEEKNVKDLVCLHNYDYDGYLTIEKVKGLIDLIVGKINKK